MDEVGISKWPKRPSLRHMATSPSLSERFAMAASPGVTPRPERSDCAECAELKAEFAAFRAAVDARLEALEKMDKYRVLGEAVLKAAHNTDKVRAELAGIKAAQAQMLKTLN